MPNPPSLRIVVGDAALFVPLEVVEVIVQAGVLTPVPATPPRIAGVFNHQGTPLPAIHPIAGTSAARHAVIVRGPRFGRFALLCDWADDLSQDAADVMFDVDALGDEILAEYGAIPAELPAPAATGVALELKRDQPTVGDRP